MSDRPRREYIEVIRQQRERIAKLEEQAAIDKDFIEQYQRQVAKLEALADKVRHYEKVDTTHARLRMRKALETLEAK